jgi:hypothetical protein
LEGIFCHRAPRFAWLKGLALVSALVLLAAACVRVGGFGGLFRDMLLVGRITLSQ